MEVIYICPDVRYWSEVLCCTIFPIHMSGLERPSDQSHVGGSVHGLRKTLDGSSSYLPTW